MASRHLIILLVGMSFVFAGNSYGFGLKAKKSNVKVLKAPKKGSDVVSSLNSGDIVNSVGRKGMYWKVEMPEGVVGFVSVMHVTRQSGGGSAVNNVLREAAQRNRDGGGGSIRSRSAVMGVRGLDASDQVAFAGNMKPDTRLVYMMEDRVVSEKRVDKLRNAIYSEIENMENQ